MDTEYVTYMFTVLNVVLHKRGAGDGLEMDGMLPQTRTSHLTDRNPSAQEIPSQCGITSPAVGSGEALIPVIGQLTDLVRRIGEQQKAEEEHKTWSAGSGSRWSPQEGRHVACTCGADSIDNSWCLGPRS